MSDPERAAAEIEANLRAHADPERAANEARYLKSHLEHIGVRVPEVRREAKRAAKEVADRAELLALVMALWATPIHERRLCAACLLQARVELLRPSDLPLLKRLVRESETWALVDVLVPCQATFALPGGRAAAPRARVLHPQGDLVLRGGENSHPEVP